MAVRSCFAHGKYWANCANIGNHQKPKGPVTGGGVGVGVGVGAGVGAGVGGGVGGGTTVTSIACDIAVPYISSA